MTAKTVLRVCVVLKWVALPVGLVLSFALADSLPAQLQAWQAEEAERALRLCDVVLGGFGFLLLVGILVASVGLMFLQRWAAWLFLACEVVGYVFYPFLGPTVEHALPDTFDEIGILLSGVVIGIAFFGGALGHKPGASPIAAASWAERVPAEDAPNRAPGDQEEHAADEAKAG